MIKVACISCEHPYELDERRLPASGLKMRCPKCGTTFLVFPDGRVQAAVQKNTILGGMVAPKPGQPVPPPAQPKKLVPPPPPPAPVDDELDLPAPRAAKATPAFADELDLPAPRGARPTPVAQVDLPAPRAKPAAPIDELDLPAPRGVRPSALADDLDLPAPRGAKPKGAAFADELDLPAPRGARPAPPGRPAPPAPPRAPLAPPFAAPAARPAAAGPLDDLDFDLPAPRKAGGAAAAPPASGLELDLPAPRRPKPAASIELDERDLPAPRRGASSADVDLPAPRRPASQRDSGIDLPAAKGAMRPQSVKPALADDSRNPFDDLGGGLDLEAPPASPPRGPAKGGFDLELDLPAPRGKAGGLDVDLPSPKRTAGRVLADADQAFGDLDLPVPKRAGMEIADLPAPVDGIDLPSLRGGVDLPAPRGMSDLPAPRGLSDLPAPRGLSDLPAARGGADLPAVRGASDLPGLRSEADLPSLSGGISDFPTARRGADLPSLGGGGGFADLDLPPPRRQAPTPTPGGSLDSDLDLPPPRARGAKASLSEFELPVPEAREGGSRGHGEIDLPDAGRDDMEFADIPQERQSATAPAARAQDDRSSPKALGRPEKKAAPGRQRSRGVAITLLVILLTAGGGAALSLTPYGPFGYYAVEQFLPGAGDAAQVATTIQHADERALMDTPTDYQAALSELATLRHDAGLNRALLARSLLHEALYQVRFGSDAGGASRSAAIRERIERRDRDDPSVALGLAADQLRLGNRTGAASLLARARAYAPNDPFVDILEGEIALQEDRFAEAPDAFRSAEEHGGGAMARWGLARTLSHADDLSQYDAAILAVLELSPRHVDALFAHAERLYAGGDDTQAVTIASQVVGAEPLGDATLVSYTALRARAWTFLGEIFEARGRTQRALDAYTQAARADPTNLLATLGGGRMLLADRPADALGRFEAVLGAAASADQPLPDGRPVSVAARLGAARAMMQLDRVQEAHASLESLVEERPDDADIQLWLGRVEEELEHPDPAEQHYRESIRLAPQVFEGYLALARLYDSRERASDAVAVLESAHGAVPETAQMHDEIGTYALSRSRLPDAEREFRRALALDATLPSARFGLGVVLRRAGRVDEAAVAFEELSAIDPGHPGLALERGLLFQARGEADRAVEFYRQALVEVPDDPDLLLRLGGALVQAGQYDEAEQTLADVQRQRPASAEAEHFVGRIAFARGRYPEAQQHFDRAIALDTTHGEFFMWSGWAALMANSLGTALSRADEALERDASLGDAYYVRGVARLRSGAVRDAQRDLERALQLRPQRTEALAALGDCHDQLRQLPEAISAYERAVAATDTNGEWWYRLGRLLLDASRTAESVHALSRATLLGEAATPRPAWLADAHRILGDGMRLSNERAGAIQHYQRYLAIAPTSAIDRTDVRHALMDMGVVPEE